MDAITRLALSVNSPLIHQIGQLLDNDLFYLALILGLVLLAERRDGKRVRMFIALIVTFVAVFFLKVVLAHPRPCLGLPGCPNDPSFPSMHAAIAFTLMLGFLNKRSYFLFLLFALFVAFTRLNLGVHSFEDVAGALPVSLLTYYFTDILFAKVMKLWKERQEGSYSTS